MKRKMDAHNGRFERAHFTSRRYDNTWSSIPAVPSALPSYPTSRSVLVAPHRTRNHNRDRDPDPHIDVRVVPTPSLETDV